MEDCMNKRFMKYIEIVIFTIVLVFFDQFTKLQVINKLDRVNGKEFINGFLNFRYVENKGVAFGLFAGKIKIITLFAIVITLIIFLLIHIIENSIININTNKTSVNKIKFTRKFTFLQFLLSSIIAGAIGNIIDRVKYGYVVDFLNFEFIDFPVFNIADCYVTVSAFILLFTLMFFIKEEELELVKFRK